MPVRMMAAIGAKHLLRAYTRLSSRLSNFRPGTPLWRLAIRAMPLSQHVCPTWKRFLFTYYFECRRCKRPRITDRVFYVLGIRGQQPVKHGHLLVLDARLIQGPQILLSVLIGASSQCNHGERVVSIRQIKVKAFAGIF